MEKKKRVGRRKFLKILGGSAVVAGAAGVLWEVWRPKPQKELARTERLPRANAYTENGKSLVSVVRGNSDTEIETMVRSAVDAIGGIGKVVSKGKKVVVKPAVARAYANYAPDPRVVAAVAKLAKEAGGTVIVAESSGIGSTAYNLSSVGITSAVEEVGAEVRDLQTEEEVQIEVPEGVVLHEVKTYPTIYNCDVLISVPRLKQATFFSVSLKNMMGTITRKEAGRFHVLNLFQCIADLNTVIKPDLAVVDATYAYTVGDMLEMNTVMASGDPVAVDTIAAQKLFQRQKSKTKVKGWTPAPPIIRYIDAAADLGVGTNNPDDMKIIEEVVS